MTMQWSEICERFCGLSITKYLISCFSPDETDYTLPKKDTWFLYLTFPDLICRLNIDDFCKTTSQTPLQFECLYKVKDKYRLRDDDEDSPHHHEILFNGKHTLVGSKLYIYDDRRRGKGLNFGYGYGDEGRNGDDPVTYYCFDPTDPDGPSVPRCDEGRDGDDPVTYYCFDPTDPEGPSVRRCDEGSIPEILTRTKSEATTFIDINNKLYVVENTDGHYEKLTLSVFDPLDQSRKQLPPIPSSHPTLRDKPVALCHKRSSHPTLSGKPVALGHKLLVITTSQSYRLDTKSYKFNTQSYMFNTHAETWEHGPVRKEYNSACYDQDVIEDIVNYGIDASVEFNGFLIGLPIGRRSIVAYTWNSDGVPRLHRVLDELDGIFCPFLLCSDFAMGKCGDGGRMWLVHIGKDLMNGYYTRVAVFRVSISNDSAGNPVLSAHLEAAEFYDFNRNSSAFALCHQPNGEEDNKKLCGTITPHARC